MTARVTVAQARCWRYQRPSTMLAMLTASQALPLANPASTSLAKCTRRNMRLAPIVNASTSAAIQIVRCQRGGANRVAT